VQQVFADQAHTLLGGSNGQSGVQFDLWSANRLVLEQAGVEQIEISEICTACHLEDWYSHRAEHGRTGRFGALIGVR
jgi:copper oxidase (laccase) domain-containing protein